jgi:hypothetical protein
MCHSGGVGDSLHRIGLADRIQYGRIRTRLLEILVVRICS